MGTLLIIVVVLLLSAAAYAQGVVATVGTLDFTSIAVAVVGGIFLLINGLFGVWLQGHIKDKQAAATLKTAIDNSLGAMQQAATMGIKSANLTIPVPPDTPDLMRVGLQYAMDHAGDEIKHLGITVPFILSKIDARVGLANIATNLATASSPLPSPRPLDPVPAASQSGKTGTLI